MKKLIPIILSVIFCFPIYLSAQLFEEGGAITELSTSTNPGGQYIRKICISQPTDDIFVCGNFDGANIDFDLSVAGTAANLSSNNGGTNDDGFIAKYDNDGSFLWVIQIKPNTSTMNMDITDMALDGSDNVYVCGYFTGNIDVDPSTDDNILTSGGGQDFFVAKYNSSGAHQWGFNIGSSDGTYHDKAYGLVLDGSDNVIVTGQFGPGTVDFDPSTNSNTEANTNGNDIFVAKYNSGGTYQWSIAMGNTASTSEHYAYDVAVDGSDNILVTGSFFYGTAVDFNPGTATNALTAIDDRDVFVAKYNSSGEYQWAFQIGSASGSGGRDDDGRCIVADASGNVYVGGRFTRGATDFDPGTGTTSLTPDIYGDAFVAKYNSSGTFQWVNSIGSIQGSPSGNQFDMTWDLIVDNNGLVYASGEFTGSSIDFDPSTNTSARTADGGTSFNDAFIVAYNQSDGSLNWVTSFGGGSAESLNTGQAVGVSMAFMDLDEWNAGTLFMAGHWNNWVNWDPEKTTTYSRHRAAEYTDPPGGIDAYIWRYGSNVGGAAYDFAWGAASSYGSGSVGGNGALALPVQLLDFSVQANGDQVEIDWSTASEINNDYFTIERSKDGKIIELVDVIAGAGNSSAQRNYSANDDEPYDGLSYYRLKQTDFDGMEKIYDWMSVNFVNSLFGFSVYPNPGTTKETTFIQLKNQEAEEVLVVVRDLTGRTAYSKIVITDMSGETIIAVDPSNELKPGIYMITATSNDKVFNQRLVIQ